MKTLCTKLLISVGIALTAFVSDAQIISTVAGVGGSNSGDGGLAILAGLEQPVCGYFDRLGNYYIVSPSGNVVRKIDAAGIITSVVGTGVNGYNGDGGLADTSKLYGPGSLTIDSIGNLFIADGSNSRIRKVNVSSGIISTIAGTGIAGYNGDGGSALVADLKSPNDICFDKFGNLYISDAANFRIRKVDVNGIITTVVGNGTIGNSGDGGLGINAQINLPRSIVTDDTGNLYIADWSGASNCIRKWNPNTGIITTYAGTGNHIYNGDGLPALSTNFNPIRLAFDGERNLWFADNVNHRIRKIDRMTTIVTTMAGDGTMAYAGDGGAAINAKLNSVSGITFDSCDNLYLTEIQQGRIRKVTYNTCLPATVKELSASQFDIYPNPAHTQIIITANSKLNHASVSNTIGQIVLQQTINEEKAELDIAHLQPGIYFVTVTDASGAKLTKKIIKE